MAKHTDKLLKKFGWCSSKPGVWCTGNILIDFKQTKDLQSDKWRKHTTINGVQLRLSGVRAHCSLSIGDPLHGSLPRIYCKIRYAQSTASSRMVLKASVKAINDTIGEIGLMPTKLVLSCLHRLPTISADIPAQEERMKAFESVQEEMSTISAERIIHNALNRFIPPAASRSSNLEEDVLLYNEKGKKSIGTFTAIQ